MLVLSLMLPMAWSPPALADTETVRVQVRFIERIQVGHGSHDESADSAAVATDPATTAPVQQEATEGSFLTALSIQATPHRAFTFNVTAAGSGALAEFVCSYGEYRRFPCGAAGLPVISVADDELRIDRSPESPRQPTTDIQVTISYQ
jgi:hypothetical protein